MRYQGIVILGRQFFADNTQILNSFPPNPAVARTELQRLESCCVAVKAWMTRNSLKLNDDKTEALLCGPRARREQIGISAVQLQSGNSLGMYLKWRLMLVLASSLEIRGRNRGRSTRPSDVFNLLI